MAATVVIQGQGLVVLMGMMTPTRAETQLTGTRITVRKVLEPWDTFSLNDKKGSNT